MAVKKYLDDVGTEYLVEKINDKIQLQFVGTKAEWEALTTAEKAKYEVVNLTDDYAVSDGWQEYVRNQNILSDYENIGSPNSSNPYTCKYDGYVNAMNSNGYGGSFYVNGAVVAGISTISNGTRNNFGTIAVKKGDIIYTVADSGSSAPLKGTFYKLRDYTGR